MTIRMDKVKSMVHVSIKHEIGRNDSHPPDRRRNPDSDSVGPNTTLLSSNEDGTQLYLVGGDQSLDLDDLDITGHMATKELITSAMWSNCTMKRKRILTSLKLSNITMKSVKKAEYCQYWPMTD